MSLTVLSVSYPFAAVDADPVGGAEQVLARCDKALVEAGHRSLVIAPQNSKTAGQLFPVPAWAGEIDEGAREPIYRAVRQRIAHVCERERPDVIHFHGIDFHAYLPPPGLPVLTTLHLPLSWYPAEALRPERPRTFLHPVSISQAALAPPGARLSEPIPNGVPVPEPEGRKGAYALALGRVCPEKGFDDALEAARRAGSPLLLAGKVFAYPEHRQFFEERIAPQLGRSAKWLGVVSGEPKQRLLARAKCLLVPSKAPETSSLVAREALAAGTPVIAYRIGALPEVVEHGRTGFLVEGVEEMADAIRAVGRLDPDACRQTALARFSLSRMTGAYLARYAELAAC